jgi:hypothetical protein
MDVSDWWTLIIAIGVLAWAVAYVWQISTRR